MRESYATDVRSFESTKRDNSKWAMSPAVHNIDYMIVSPPKKSPIMVKRNLLMNKGVQMLQYRQKKHLLMSKNVEDSLRDAQ